MLTHHYYRMGWGHATADILPTRDRPADRDAARPVSRGLERHSPGRARLHRGLLRGRRGADGARAASRARQTDRADQRPGPQPARPDERDVAGAWDTRG